MLTVVFREAYFSYNMRVYKQLDGLFMGCRPSPIAAIVCVWQYERNSIYLELLVAYGRYIDDVGSVAGSREEAERMTNSIAAQDTSGKIRWEVDFPEQPETDFVAFLDTEIRIREEGLDAPVLDSRYYRKAQKKNITLNWRSHHPTPTKVEVAKNFYKRATEASSGPTELDHSLKIVDNLLKVNGYENARERFAPAPLEHRKKNRRGREGQDKKVALVLPYMSDHLTHRINNYVRQKKLPIRPIFTPGRKLGKILTSSRPLDSPKCHLGNTCKVCPNMESPGCAVQGAVYRITCNRCPRGAAEYIGETSRSFQDRAMEHRRACNNPPAYPENALGKHYLETHSGEKADLSYEVLQTQRVPVKRKVAEAYIIHRDRPKLNNRDEMPGLRRFFV
mgnify:CR=1 FL=1